MSAGRALADRLGAAASAHFAAMGRRGGRAAWGERKGRARLTAAAVVAIRADHAAGAPIRLLARRHGVDHSAVWQVVRYRTWRRVGGAA